MRTILWWSLVAGCVSAPGGPAASKDTGATATSSTPPTMPTTPTPSTPTGATTPTSTTPAVEDCANGVDDDRDGAVDCADEDCDGGCPEDCADGRDNDGNGAIDCDDRGCATVCDADRDGYVAADRGGDDCDDTDPAVNPGEAEVCNPGAPVDDDCDGLADDDDPDVDSLTFLLWGRDRDGDGHGSDEATVQQCAPPDGFAAGDADCDDLEPAVHPDAPEICNADGPRDDDCDGLFDRDDPDMTEDDLLEWFLDEDGDGFGAGDASVVACERPGPAAPRNDDCDDGDPSVGPPSLWYADPDGDGFGEGAPVAPTPSCEPPGPDVVPDWIGLDCGPGDPALHPGAPEVCDDGVDQDCDGVDMPCVLWVFGAYEGVPTVFDPSVAYGDGRFSCAETCAPYGLDGIGARWVCNHHDGEVGEGCGPDNHGEWSETFCTEQILDGVYVPGRSPTCSGERYLRNFVEGEAEEPLAWHAIECQCG